MLIKFGALRTSDDMHRMSLLGVDMLSINPLQRLLPSAKYKYNIIVAIFRNVMPQNIITAVYEKSLTHICLHGSENRIYINNLRHTIQPDIAQQITIIKSLRLEKPADIDLYKNYEGSIDICQFNIKNSGRSSKGANETWLKALHAYDGTTPFIVSMPIDESTLDMLLALKNPLFIGINIPSTTFLTKEGRDYKKLQKLVEYIRYHENA